MLRRALLSLTLICAALIPFGTAANEEAGAVYDALGLPDILSIMREEGIAYGAELEGDLFLSEGGAQWAATVEGIYDRMRMEDTVRRRLMAELDDTDMAPILAFFDSERGRRIVELEVSARRALLDKDVDAASRAALEEMIIDDDPRLALLREFVEVNDLIESNVVGAMNSNVAFYNGLADGGAFPSDIPEAVILQDVWSQEAQIRSETEEWIFSYLALAYRPLPDTDLEAYVEFSETAAGRALNNALFMAFDEMFNAISLALGRAAAGFVAGQEL